MAALGLLLIFLLAACSGRISFTATVLSNTEGILILRPDADSDVGRSGDMLRISTDGVKIEDAAGHSFSGEDIQEGALLKIYYDGKVLESYPLQLTKVTKIILLDS